MHCSMGTPSVKFWSKQHLIDCIFIIHNKVFILRTTKKCFFFKLKYPLMEIETEMLYNERNTCRIYKIEHHHHRTSNQIIIIDNEVYFSLPFSSHRHSNEGQIKKQNSTRMLISNSHPSNVHQWNDFFFSFFLLFLLHFL